MKQSEMRPCVCCGRGIMHGGDIVAYRVTVEQHLVDVGAVQRQHGLEMMMGGGMGGAAIAAVMGTNSDLTKMASSVSGLICQPCFMDWGNSIAEVWEALGKASPDAIEVPTNG